MNTRRQLIIAAGAAVAVTVLFFVFLLQPKLGEIEDAQRETQGAIDRESTYRAELARLQALSKQEPQTRAKLATLMAYLPSAPDLPSFIRQAQAAATGAGVDLNSIAPTQPADLEGAKGIQTISATLTVHGGFHRMEDLLARLEGLQRVVEVRAIALSPVVDPLSGETVLDGTITLTMYVVADDAVFSKPTTAKPAPSPTGSP